ncbi:mannose-6-phosphate isomerase, class I [Jatrophihabitans telluris]|uniref:mannose-6-phosphate isomerase, class I n=1 Tax=Jatrophihabitans telluris TaxID=2038343 RepID=UPI003221A503
MIRLDNGIRNYAWGSTTDIPRLLGLPVTGEPVAELWMGAHPDQPSRARDQRGGAGLDELIASDPIGLLGAPTRQRYGARLPYLLKLLAAGKCLSIQVHPNQEQARAGYDAEVGGGPAVDAGHRNYTDPHHKPELLCALTEFEALCGFRPVAATLDYLGALIGAGAGRLAGLRELLGGRDPLRAAFTELLELSGPSREVIVAETTAAARALVAEGGRWSGAARASVLAAGDFPGDIGVVLAVLLNYVRLNPGEAIFLRAGNVHAYLRGFGVEILANSDNVLRCGLTEKHIDVAELLKVTDFRALDEPLWPRTSLPSGQPAFVVPVPDFELVVLQDMAEFTPVAVAGPSLVVCTAGSLQVRAAGEIVSVAQGQSVFVPARNGPPQVRAQSAHGFLAAVGG